MESKDDRSKSKRSKMKQHNYRKATRNTVVASGNTSSSSPRQQAVRSIIDVADSSDDRFTDGRGWIRSKVAPQPTQRFSLENTLDEIDNMDNEQLHAPDFEQMAQMPSSVGGHFRFSSEKNWDLIDNQELLNGTAASEYFTLNLKLLNVGLQTIPFYKRMDYPVGMFSTPQIKEMEKNAEAAEARYQQMLKEHNDNVNSTQNTKSSNQEATVNNIVNDTTVLLENVKLNGKENLPVSLPAPPEAQDIQQWLDNVLDE